LNIKGLCPSPPKQQVMFSLACEKRTLKHGSGATTNMFIARSISRPAKPRLGRHEKNLSHTAHATALMN
jgi:hypothetical protein